jgi:hypothetical protein
VFVAAPNDVKDFHVPSDLSGFILAMYRSKRSDGNITAALGTACNKIRRELVKLRAEDVRGVPTIIQRGFFSDFVSTFPSLFLNSKKIILYFIHSRRWREECNDHIH